MPLPVLSADDSSTSPPGGRRGRLPRYALRVSLLEQCTYRCPYCLPGAVTPYTARARWLQPDDYRRLARLFHARGVDKVRLTGGEPLLRPDVAAIARAFADVFGDTIALTTNGQLLDDKLDALVDAGVRLLTVHVDSLRPDRYRHLMGEGDPRRILAVVERARRRLDVVKVNMVVQRGHNDDELLDMLALSRRSGLEVRFIELMNTGSADAYTRAAFLPGREIVARIHAADPVHPLPRRHPSDPAALYRCESGVVFGVIASDTEPFCDHCDRLRLTADGRLRGCLYQSDGVPLGAALRARADDDTLLALLDAGLEEKRSFHPLAAPTRIPFSMADVGG